MHDFVSWLARPLIAREPYQPNARHNDHSGISMESPQIMLTNTPKIAAIHMKRRRILPEATVNIASNTISEGSANIAGDQTLSTY